MLASERARPANMNCEVISTVKHDQSEPVVDVTFNLPDVYTELDAV